MWSVFILEKLITPLHTSQTTNHATLLSSERIYFQTSCKMEYLASQILNFGWPQLSLYSPDPQNNTVVTGIKVSGFVILLYILKGAEKPDEGFYKACWVVGEIREQWRREWRNFRGWWNMSYSLFGHTRTYTRTHAQAHTNISQTEIIPCAAEEQAVRK